MIIYKNTNYITLIKYILEKKFEISKLAIYKFFDSKKLEINKVINQNNDNLNLEFFSKIIYHLCLASCYLTEKLPDKSTLLEIKNIYKPITAELKQIAINYLKLGLNYIDKFPVDYRKELTKIYDELQK
jgi:hypothetical protein